MPSDVQAAGRQREGGRWRQTICTTSRNAATLADNGSRSLMLSDGLAQICSLARHAVPALLALLRALLRDLENLSGAPPGAQIFQVRRAASDAREHSVYRKTVLTRIEQKRQHRTTYGWTRPGTVTTGTQLRCYGSERPGAVPLIIRKRSLDAFQHAHGRHGRVGVLLGSAKTAWHGLYTPNMGLFDHFACIRGPCRDQGGDKQPIHAPSAGHGGFPNAGRTPSNTPATPAAVPAHGPADLIPPPPPPGAGPQARVVLGRRRARRAVEPGRRA